MQLTRRTLGTVKDARSPIAAWGMVSVDPWGYLILGFSTAVLLCGVIQEWIDVWIVRTSSLEDYVSYLHLRNRPVQSRDQVMKRLAWVQKQKPYVVASLVAVAGVFLVLFARFASTLVLSGLPPRISALETTVLVACMLVVVLGILRLKNLSALSKLLGSDVPNKRVQQTRQGDSLK